MSSWLTALAVAILMSMTSTSEGADRLDRSKNQAQGSARAFGDVVRGFWRDGVRRLDGSIGTFASPAVRSYAGPVLGALPEGPLGFVPRHIYLNENVSIDAPLFERVAYGARADDEIPLYDLLGPRQRYDGVLHAAGLVQGFEAAGGFGLDVGGGLYQQESFSGEAEHYGFELDAGARWSSLGGLDLYGRMAYREYRYERRHARDLAREDDAVEFLLGVGYRLDTWRLDAALRHQDVDSNVPGMALETHRVELNLTRRW